MNFTRGLIAGLAVLVLGACDRSDPDGTAIARMRCLQPGANQYLNCELELQQAGGFEIVLDYTECQAHGNIVRLLKPVEQVLTENGCYLPVGTEWAFPGPFDAGTKVALEIESARLQNPPEIRVEGSWPSWMLFFEDGADQDFNDLILQITATPID